MILSISIKNTFKLFNIYNMDSNKKCPINITADTLSDLKQVQALLTLKEGTKYTLAEIMAIATTELKNKLTK